MARSRRRLFRRDPVRLRLCQGHQQIRLLQPFLCPPAAQRVFSHDDHADAAGTPKFDKIKQPPDQIANGFVVNMYEVEDDDSLLLSSLIQIVADGNLRATLSEASSGSGTKLIGLLRAEAAKASALDYARSSPATASSMSTPACSAK
jgi:hypothetical protein